MVFFSGTDWSELEDNAPNHNFYLSLIVNNFMDFCAKVCFVAKSPVSSLSTFKAKDEHGEEYAIEQNEIIPSKEKLITYDCKINAPQNNIVVEESFAKKVSTIIEECDKKLKIQENNVPNWKFKNTNIKNMGSVLKQKTPPSWDSNYGDSIDYDYYYGKELRCLEDFTFFVLNLGNKTSPEADIVEILEKHKKNNITGTILATKVLEKYVQLYENFFDAKENKDVPSVFTDITEKVIDTLYDEILVSDASDHNFVENMLDPVAEGLEIMLNKFKNFEKY